MEDKYCNSLEGVGDGKDDSNPGEAGVEVEESREPADAKNTDQRHAALHLCDDLRLGVQIVVPPTVILQLACAFNSCSSRNTFTNCFISISFQVGISHY